MNSPHGLQISRNEILFMADENRDIASAGGMCGLALAFNGPVKFSGYGVVPEARSISGTI